MAKTLPARFNPDLMVRDGTRYEATLPIRHFPRLVSLLASDEGDVTVTASFSRRKDHIVVAGRIEAVWGLVCQRCLEPMTVPTDEPYELVFVEDEAAARDLPQELDPVILDENGQIHAVDLYEDELMLHVPSIPRHPDVTACGEAAGRLVDPDELESPAEDKRPNPFAALKDLNLH